jgi:hypothetical protein
VTSVLLVFAQRADARVDIVGWNAHAERFFATRLGLAEEKRYAATSAAPSRDSARFVVTPAGGAAVVRSAWARPTNAQDILLAHSADARAGRTGLAGLAARCRTVWGIEREIEPDLPSLRLAIVLASVLLGPICDPDAGVLLGVKSARAELEAYERLGR